VDWKKLRAEYIAGGTSYRKLADKHHVPLGTLKRIAHDENWVGLREQCNAKAVSKIIEIESDKQANRMQRLLDVSDKLLQAVEDAVDSFMVGELTLDKSALKQLSGTIKDIKEIQSIKTELDIEEQKARIANLKRQAAAEEKSEGITIVMGEAEEYSL
jgi:hypothetical protein